MPDTALLVIDIQNDYFPGGAMELEGADAAGAKAGAALEKFRKNGNPVIHVRHLSVRPGSTFFLPGTQRRGDPSLRVAPRGGETVVEKNFPNSFRGTRLRADAEGFRRQEPRGRRDDDAHVRGRDACATPPISATRSRCSATRARRARRATPARQVPARQVHAAFLAALNGFYAKVVPSHEL